MNLPVWLDKHEVDNFTLTQFRSCLMYGHYRCNRGLIKPSERRTPLDFGAAIHSALEHYYKNFMTEAAKQEAVVKFVQEYTPLQAVEDTKRTVMTGMKLLSKYFKRYPSEPFEVVATEVGGAFQLNSEWTYLSRLDLIVEWRQPKGIYVIDHKTSSAIERVLGNPANYMTGYIYNAAEIYENILGGIVNVLGVYASDKKRNPEGGPMIERDPFIRIPTGRSRVALELWKREVAQQLHLIEDCFDKQIWPKHAPEYCTAYRGKCWYLDLCRTDDDDIRERMIEESGLYEVKVWRAWGSEDMESED